MSETMSAELLTNSLRETACRKSNDSVRTRPVNRRTNRLGCVVRRPDDVSYDRRRSCQCGRSRITQERCGDRVAGGHTTHRAAKLEVVGLSCRYFRRTVASRDRDRNDRVCRRGRYGSPYLTTSTLARDGGREVRVGVTVETKT